MSVWQIVRMSGGQHVSMANCKDLRMSEISKSECEGTMGCQYARISGNFIDQNCEFHLILKGFKAFGCPLLFTLESTDYLIVDFEVHKPQIIFLCW